MSGKGSVSHNTRAFTAKNADSSRNAGNVQFCHSDIRQVYHQLFDEVLEKYNAKQKRNDRKTDDYYEKIRQGRQEKLFHEVIFQIGDRNNTNAKSSEGHLAKQILWENFKNAIPICMYFQRICIWMSKPRIYILILCLM